MATYKQCDRTFCIRLTKVLQRVATTLPYQPAWINVIPVVPDKGVLLLPAEGAFWLSLAKNALSDLVTHRLEMGEEEFTRGMTELTAQLSQWSHSKQGARADSRK